MRKTDIAESILRLTTTPERAMAIAGDLEEEASTQLPHWFWLSLTRTVAALVWQDWMGSPMRMFGLAVGACLYQLVLAVAGTVLVLGGGMLARSAVGVFFVVNPLGFHQFAAKTAASVAASLVVVACQFPIGRWLAKRSRDSALAACLSYLVVQRMFDMALGLIVVAAIPRSSANFTAYDFVLGLSTQIAGWIFLFAGAAHLRSRWDATLVR